jgi:DMSO reductase anchor subunit
LHPAYSVIFFTTASGLGYGLLILLGVMGAAGLIAADRAFAVAAFGVAFAAVTLGLFASTLHLGHPDRAWRAFSQWRSSWLSREGVAAVATYLPTGLFALGWIVWQDTGGGIGLVGVIGAAGAVITVYCTGMIYASLPTIAAWSNRWTVPGYLVLALATGSLWLAALARMFDVAHPAITHLPVGLIMLAWIVKVAYWWTLDNTPRVSTRQTATGLGGEGVPVRFLAAPHTQDNFVMREMGYRIARKHAMKLRRTAQALAFAAPLVLTELDMFWPDAPAGLHTALAVVSACIGTAGVALERWLFFAEARHVVTLYYEPGRH